MILFTTFASGNNDAERLIAKWASEDEHAQAVLKSLPSKRHDFLLARSALRALLQEVTGTADWIIEPDAHGKPHAFSPTGEVGPSISLSHTKGMVACAVSLDCPIGIDIEYWHPRDFTALATYAFTSEESEHVSRTGEEVFYRFWTQKEAKAKAIGRGIFSVIKGADSSHEHKDEKWFFYSKEPLPKYSLCLAYRGTQSTVTEISLP